MNDGEENKSLVSDTAAGINSLRTGQSGTTELCCPEKNGSEENWIAASGQGCRDPG